MKLSEEKMSIDFSKLRKVNLCVNSLPYKVVLWLILRTEVHHAGASL